MTPSDRGRGFCCISPGSAGPSARAQGARAEIDRQDSRRSRQRDRRRKAQRRGTARPRSGVREDVEDELADVLELRPHGLRSRSSQVVVSQHHRRASRATSVPGAPWRRRCPNAAGRSVVDCHRSSRRRGLARRASAIRSFASASSGRRSVPRPRAEAIQLALAHPVEGVARDDGRVLAADANAAGDAGRSKPRSPRLRPRSECSPAISATASATSGRGGSNSATRPRNVRSCSA